MLFFVRINKFLQIFLISALFIALTKEESTFAQQKNAPFSEINVGINLGLSKSGSFLENYWKSGKSGEVFIEMPFYYGQISGGVLIIPNSSKEADMPDYRSMFVFAGFGKSVNLPLNTSLSVGTRLGNFSMTFDDDTVNVNLKTESEFAAAFYSKLSIQTFQNWNINLEAEMIKVFTHNKISILHLSAGVSYSFPSPAWFREIFD